MSIQFGDILKHNNPNFPITDISDVKGGLRSIATFSDAGLISEYTSGAGGSIIPGKYKSGYSLLLETSTSTIYYFSGTSATSSSDWTRVGVGGNGTGVTNSVAKWIGTSTLGVGSITDDGDTVTINANLMVIGTTSTVNTENLLVKDPIILLAGSQSGTPTLDSGLFINRGTGATQAFIWDESMSEFKFISTPDGATVSGNVSITDYSNVRTGVLKVGSGDFDSNDRFVVSSSSGTVSLVVDEIGYVQLAIVATTSVATYSILTRNDITGKVEKIASSDIIKWYAETTTPPLVPPVATGTGSIAIGNNTEALSNNTFVYGDFAGLGATGSGFSNLLGYYAGFQTSNSINANIIGNYAGFQSSNSDSSNFIGNYAGFQSPGSDRSNFIGDHAGLQSPGSTSSNFIGDHAGAQSSNVTNSNFIGEAAGKLASYAIFSNFIGNYAGQGAVGSDYSNFIGDNAGQNSTHTGNSNFLGNMAGKDAGGASYSNFLGRGAGQNAGGSHNSNFIGNLAGNLATTAYNSNFFGQNSGKYSDNANNSNFLGFNSGENAYYASNSNFLGNNSGSGAGGASNSNFLGNNSGQNAANANNSNFIGERAGKDAVSANNSNFLGEGAGQSATTANNSNFLGQNAGLSSYSNNSNFFGQNSGEFTQFANNSNFFGFYAGAGANNANDSNFFGYSAGQNATGASNSNLFGFNAGKTFTSNSIGSNNIVIGTNISLPNGVTNSLNIGGVLFGLNTYNNTIGDPSITAQTNGRIGINVVTPNCDLEIKGNQTFTVPDTYSKTSGDVVYFGTGTSLTAGSIYYYNGSAWQLADASAEATSSKLLAISLGTSVSDGMLLRGFSKFNNTLYTTMTAGSVQFLSVTPGEFEEAQPSVSGEVVRVIGYCVDDTNNVLYFCPDTTWIELL